MFEVLTLLKVFLQPILFPSVLFVTRRRRGLANLRDAS